MGAGLRGLPAQIAFVVIFSLASWSSEERLDLVSCCSGPVELWVDVPRAVLCCSEPGLSTVVREVGRSQVLEERSQLGAARCRVSLGCRKHRVVRASRVAQC